MSVFGVKSTIKSVFSELIFFDCQRERERREKRERERERERREILKIATRLLIILKQKIDIF